MSEVFLFLLNKSITAGWVILAVLLLRLLLRRAPRWITCLMWGVAGLRLMLPFSIESVFSLIPAKQTIPTDIATSPAPSVTTGVPALNAAVNPYIAEGFTPSPAGGVNPLQVVLTVATWVWVAGMIGMLLYGVISYWRLKRRVRVSLLQCDNVYLCDGITSPFILGIWKPRIYLPSGLAGETAEAVIAHEKAHLSRRDHWIKPLGFLLLSVYWFNPLLWVAYLLLCRDIEAACDEKVVKAMDIAARKAYSTALVQCSTHRRVVAACPLAFGEVGVKARVRAVLNYKKPAFWIVLVAVIASIAVAVCFLTDPENKDLTGIGTQTSTVDRRAVSLAIVKSDLTAPYPYLTVRWNNRLAEDITYGEPFTLYYKEDDAWVNCALDDRVWTMPAYYIRAGGTGEKTYSLVGQMMTQPGEYRLEASYTVGNRQEIAWVEFTLTRGVEQGGVYTFDPSELWYVQGGYSYVLFPEAAPTWQLVNDRQLYEIGDDGVVNPIGRIVQVELDENSFDSRFIGAAAWEEGVPTLASIKKNNQRAWQVYCGENTLYLLLEQKDGTFLMGYGSYNRDFIERRNSDNSEIRWLYRLETVDGAGIDMSQPALDGAVYFYDVATEEHDTPVLATYYQASTKEVDALMELLEEQQWVYDGVVDRVLFHLDGRMKYNDKWLYFGYDDKVVQYGEYFCTASDDVLTALQTMKKRAVPFSGA